MTVYKKNLEKAANLQKKYNDVGFKARKYKPNDFVWRWYLPLANLKLGLDWTGPYKVLNMSSSVTCKSQKYTVAKLKVVYVDHLKPYEGHSIPSTWQYMQIDTTPKQVSPDMNESANSEIDWTTLHLNHMLPGMVVRLYVHHYTDPKRSLRLSRKKSDDAQYLQK